MLPPDCPPRTADGVRRRLKPRAPYHPREAAGIDGTRPRRPRPGSGHNDPRNPGEGSPRQNVTRNGQPGTTPPRTLPKDGGVEESRPGEVGPRGRPGRGRQETSPGPGTGGTGGEEWSEGPGGNHRVEGRRGTEERHKGKYKQRQVAAAAPLAPREKEGTIESPAGNGEGIAVEHGIEITGGDRNRSRAQPRKGGRRW